MKAMKLGLWGMVACGAALLLGCGSANAGEAKAITVKGSDTMVHLSSSWAEEYMKKNKDADISVTGGGSGTGIAAIINGTADLCNASRKIEEKEVKLAKEKGVDVKEFTAALDGICIVVNPANPLNEITLDQLFNLYTGAVKNWKEIGGADEPVVLLSRENSSGTYVFFQEHVLKKKDYAKETRLMPATSAIITETASAKGGIGYVGLGYANEAKGKVKVLPVKAKADGKAVPATIETVVSGEYPISRSLNLYTRGEPAGQLKAFIDFCLGAEGQKLVETAGFVPLPKK